VTRAAHHAKAASAGSIDVSGKSRGLLIAALAVIASLAFGASVVSAADPTVIVDSVTTHGITTAHATGTITTDSEANGGAEVFYFFEFRQVKPVGEEEAWSLGPQAFTRTVPAETTAQAVEEDLTGLKANTAYEVRLAAFNGNTGAETDSAPSAPFTTDPAPNAPALALGLVVPFYTSAQLSGTVDPEGGNLNAPGSPVPIHWAIEISESGDPGTWGPVAEGDIADAEAEGSAPIAVPASAAEPTGLAPNTTYHYRLRATYAGLEVETSPAATFTTEPVAKPTVTLDPITIHGDTTATFSGEVDTNAPAGPLSPQAEAAFRAEWHFSCAPACPNLAPAGGTGTVEAAEGSKAISVDATGLEPNTSYEVTLEATNAGGAESDAKAFATDLVAPSVNPGPGRSDGHGGYHLEAALNPHNSAISSCSFEYGPSAAYGQSIPCASNPGAVNKTFFVTAHVTGLTLGTPYHFRVTAANGAGPTTSADATFVPSGSCPNEARREEQESTFLPECRAYELVTSPYKQGFAINKQSYGDDGAVAYNSTGSFADNAYGGLYNQYVARRSETGWKSISMTPPGEQWVFWGPEGNQSGLSGDFRSALWPMRPRSGPGERWADHSDRDGLYVSQPDGGFSLLAPNPGTSSLRVFTTTPDLSHIVLGGNYGQPAPNLYEVVGGDQVLRPIAVDNTGAPLPDAGMPNADGLCSQGISADGRVIFFGHGDAFAGCSEPRARVGGATTIDLAASQCTRGAGDLGGVCNADTRVEVLGFARDGSRAFMTTTQQLVNGDTDATNDLYMCEIPAGAIAPELPVNKCPNLRQLTTGAAGGADVENLVRASTDGSHVYFLAHAVLADNQGANDQTAVAGAHNLYVWKTDAEHPEGHTTFVARLATPEDVGNQGQSSTQLTSDGRYLLVNTRDQLVTSGAGADTDSASDVYRYDAQTGQWLRLSTDATGSGGNAETEAFVWFYDAMTDDGNTVVFTTNEVLAPADVSSGIDVYSWHEGQISLISPEGGGAHPGISASGTDIFFRSSSHVTAADSDTSVDVFDARIGGGFDLREPAPSCEGEACKGPLATPPSSSALGSTGVGGGGNVKEKPRKCPKGKRKVRGKAGKSRCVPKRSGSRHSTRHHSAGGNGSAHK
jgi:hypothetical protein